MKRFYMWTRLIFLAALIVMCAGLWAYKWFYVWPRERCEAAGDWWDPKDRRCGVPVAIWHFTGRPPPSGQPASAPPAHH